MQAMITFQVSKQLQVARLALVVTHHDTPMAVGKSCFACSSIIRAHKKCSRDRVVSSPCYSSTMWQVAWRRRAGAGATTAGWVAH